MLAFEKQTKSVKIQTKITDWILFKLTNYTLQ